MTRVTGSVTQRGPEEVFIDGLSVPVYLSHEPDVAPDPGAAHLASVAWPGLTSSLIITGQGRGHSRHVYLTQHMCT